MLATKHYRMKARTAELTVTVTAAKEDAPRLGQPEQLHEGLPNCDGSRVTKTGLQGLAVTLWRAPVTVARFSARLVWGCKLPCHCRLLGLHFNTTLQDSGVAESFSRALTCRWFTAESFTVRAGCCYCWFTPWCSFTHMAGDGCCQHKSSCRSYTWLGHILWSKWLIQPVTVLTGVQFHHYVNNYVIITRGNLKSFKNGTIIMYYG